MAVLIFLLVLIILVVVHELGHFSVAKLFGIRVDEFGLGFPPRIGGFKYGETLYSLNWIPFGGFVKIFGENPDDDSISGADSARSMVNKPKLVQVTVLVAGVTFNVIFAWLIISLGFMSGLPASVQSYPANLVKNPQVVLTSIESGSPAEKAGLQTGDVVLSLTSDKTSQQITTVEQAQNFIAANGSSPITIVYTRGKTEMSTIATPVTGIVSGKVALGIGMDLIGTLKLSFFQALWQGAKLTYNLLISIVVGLFEFFKQIFIFKADFSQVTGPVGIVSLVGDASKLGFIYLLSFTAFISLNLAVINLLPFPALDGGRVLFIIIEKIKGSPIKPKVANMLNTIGFLLLIGLMIIVTFHDLWKLWG